MPVTVKVAPIGFDKFLPVDEAVMRDVGDLAIRMIRTRTEQGKDKDGGAFVAYTPKYAELKAKELGAGPVNLTVSGRMLNDMEVSDTGPNRASIGFRSSGGRATGKTFIQRSRSVGAEDKARWHDRDGAGKSRIKRPFMGLTDAETAKVQDRVEKYLAERVARFK